MPLILFLYQLPPLVYSKPGGCYVREADLGAMNFPSQRPVD